MMIIDTRGGLGDNIYARAIVRAYAESDVEAVVRSPWPQLFCDLPVPVQKPGNMELRTQKKNIARLAGYPWANTYYRGADVRRLIYRLEVPGRTIMQELESMSGWPAGAEFRFDLPSFGPSLQADKPIAVLRPVTSRIEWPNRARSPDTRYIVRAAELLREAGFHVVVAADVDDKYEHAIQPLPVGDTMLIRGELDVTQLMALVENAAVVVGGSGWIIPACMAYGTPAVIIGGGNGGHNAPELVTDPRVDCSRIRFVLPDRYCRCINMRHGCNKIIHEFDERFTSAMEEVAACSLR
jgi:hypothetical protein